MGIHEQVLKDLEKTWEAKILASGVADFHNWGPEQDAATQAATAAAAAAAALASAAAGQAAISVAGMGNTIVKQEPVNGSYGLPQNDGMQGETSNQGSVEISSKDLPDGQKDLSTSRVDEMLIRSLESSIALIKRRKTLPQNDGGHDEDEEEEEEEEGEDGIDSDLDDEDSEEEQDSEHIILCQYEKVSRIKNKWKCVLRDGIVNVNGKDYLFNKANGDFEW
ncbi:transcription factor IIA subunit alpha [Phlyctochytrium bullatum]|nr:transcription factor IIA subunit alpha [Phlyctochytrium bullatum]